jgi:hypothetical protein
MANKPSKFNRINANSGFEQNVCKALKVRRFLKFKGWQGTLSTEFSTVLVEKKSRGLLRCFWV